jgi:hypothetical protein
MPMDFNYTNRFDKYPDDRNVYHALTRCRAAEDIKVKHREFGTTPAVRDMSGRSKGLVRQPLAVPLA